MNNDAFVFDALVCSSGWALLPLNLSKHKFMIRKKYRFGYFHVNQETGIFFDRTIDICLPRFPVTLPS